MSAKKVLKGIALVAVGAAALVLLVRGLRRFVPLNPSAITVDLAGGDLMAGTRIEDYAPDVLSDFFKSQYRQV